MVRLVRLVNNGVERDGKTAVDQNRWVKEAMKMFGEVYGGATAYPKAKGVGRDDERGGALSTPASATRVGHRGGAVDRSEHAALLAKSPRDVCEGVAMLGQWGGHHSVRVGKPSEQAVLPEEQALLPEEQALLPDEHAVLPREQAVLPHEHVLLLHEHAVLRHEEAVLPCL